MLQQVWTEFDYRLDVVRVTKGSHIEHLLVPYIQNIILLINVSYIITFELKMYKHFKSDELFWIILYNYYLVRNS